MRSDAGDEVRPYRLVPVEIERVHARPWDDHAISRLRARARQFGRLGFGDDDASDLAERLTLRDVERDDRRMCVGECRHLAGSLGGFRCGNAVAAGLIGDRTIGTDLATTLQRCAGFSGVRHGED